MSMITITGLEGAIAEVVDKSDILQRAAEESIKQAADRTCELAKEFVPIDEANLQDAIFVDRLADNHYQVKIDLNHKGTRPAKKGEYAGKVGQYAMIMHYGSYSAKAGWPRGPLFMDRAAARAQDEVLSANDSPLWTACKSILRSFKLFF